MKEGDKVEFVGLLPKELQGLKKGRKRLFGTVLRVEEVFILVKPRYKHCEVIVNKKDLVVVEKELFYKQKKKKSRPKPSTTKQCITKKKILKSQYPKIDYECKLKIVSEPVLREDLEDPVEEALRNDDKALYIFLLAFLVISLLLIFGYWILS